MVLNKGENLYDIPQQSTHEEGKNTDYRSGGNRDLLSTVIATWSEWN